MRITGCILILLSAGGMYLGFRRSALEVLRLAETLYEDLALLRCGICIHRRTLPEILMEDLGQDIAAVSLWLPLATALSRSDGTVRSCWEQAVQNLPQPLDAYLKPLGALLPAGGETLGGAIDEVRGELLEYVRMQRAQQSVKLRLTAAMCFSMAALFILICI